MSQANVISMSGGKDSTATALLAIERDVENRFFVFADTGHEHPATYDYLGYLESSLGITIHRVKADFSSKIIEKRKQLIAHAINLESGAKQRNRRLREYTYPTMQRMIDALEPTGNPFLDLCLWKGRFPSTRRRFCSEQLKHVPLDEFTADLLQRFDEVVSWQGVRRDESRERARLPEEEDHPTTQGLVWYRPILDWTAADCFDIAARHGLEPNPLYKEGMGRVGCMPCIHCTKSETAEISIRFPEQIQRLAEWEIMVSDAAKRGASTFFDAGTVQRSKGLPKITKENLHTVSPDTHGVRHYVEWAKTGRGGRQYDLIAAIEAEAGPTCKSLYGLCE